MLANCGSHDCCIQCPWPCARPLLVHTSARNSWTLTGKSGTMSCGVTTPVSWFWYAQSFVCALQESVSPVMRKFCNQIPLAFIVKVPGGSQSLYWIPRLGNLSSALEVSQEWELLCYIVLQFVGCLSSSSVVGLMVNSYKRNYAGFCISQVCCSQGPCPHSRPLLTHAGDT